MSLMARPMASPARRSSVVSRRRSFRVAREVGGDTLMALGRPASIEGTEIASEYRPGSYSWFDLAMPSARISARAPESARHVGRDRQRGHAAQHQHLEGTAAPLRAAIPGLTGAGHLLLRRLLAARHRVPL